MRIENIESDKHEVVNASEGTGMFEAVYENLSQAHPEWGRVAVLDWDARIFGFPVADYQAGDARAINQSRFQFAEELDRWARTRQVELIGCSIPATDAQWYALLPIVGFDYVDYTLKIYHNDIGKTALPEANGKVRCAQPEDRISVERIAATAFRAGRYYADPRFPRELVARRYRHWLSNAFDSLGAENLIFVTGELGNVTGFYHATRQGDTGAISIIAVDPPYQRGTTAVELVGGAASELARLGVHKMSSKISALNSPVMNLANFFRWRFTDPQVVFHWHAPYAPHLNSRDSIYNADLADATIEPEAALPYHSPPINVFGPTHSP